MSTRFGRAWRQGESRGRGGLAVVLGGAGRVAAGAGLAAVASFLKETQVAAVYGLSAGLDLYLFALAVTLFTAGVLVSAFQAAFIPLWTASNEAEQRELLGAGVSQALALGGLAWVAQGLVFPTLVSWIGMGTEAGPAAIERLGWLVGALLVLTPVNALGHGVLHREGRFLLAAALPAVGHGVTLIALLLAAEGAPIALLAGAVAAGVALETGVLVRLLGRRGLSFRPLAPWGAVGRRFFRRMGGVSVAASMVTAIALTDRAMAATLGEGAVAALGFADRVPSVARSLGSVALATALLPHFSERVAAGDYHGALRLTMRLAMLAAAAGFVAAAVIAWPSEWLVQGLFQRGAFTAKDVAVVAAAQQAYAFQAPGALVDAIAMRLLISVGAHGLMARVTAVCLVLNACANWVLMRHFGPAGVAWSTALVSAVSAGLALTAARRRLTLLATTGPRLPS